LALCHPDKPASRLIKVRAALARRIFGQPWSTPQNAEEVTTKTTSRHGILESLEVQLVAASEVSI
jgi:hypothetical protein